MSIALSDEFILSVCPKETTIRKYDAFQVNVTITNVTNLGAYEFVLFYNSTVLRCTGVELPTNHILEPVYFVVRLLYDNKFNKTHGLVLAALTLIGDIPGKNGSGTLINVNFTAAEEGISLLDFREVMLCGIENRSVIICPPTIIDGVVNVLPALDGSKNDQEINATASDDFQNYADDYQKKFIDEFNDDPNSTIINDFYQYYNSTTSSNSTSNGQPFGQSFTEGPVPSQPHGVVWISDSHTYTWEPYAASAIILAYLLALIRLILTRSR